MQLEHEFTVPVPVGQAWEVLLDVERMAPCMPGATIDSVEGDSFTGRVKVKVGPVTVSYSGSASFREKDADARRVVVEAKGKETRGAGTAAATVTAQLREADAETRVSVVTDLAITGRPAQFGRGVMDDVGKKLLGQFAECVASRLGQAGTAGAAAGNGQESAAEGAAEGNEGAERPAGEPVSDRPPAEPARPTPDAINVFNVAGASVAKRLAPLLAIIVVLIGVWALIALIG